MAAVDRRRASSADESPFAAFGPDGSLQLRLPSLGATAPVEGVGITDCGAMDAPMGPADAPAWQEAFWYRGSAVPGDASTAVLDGHVDDPRSRPGTSARLDQRRAGDPIAVRDNRTGREAPFVVDSTTSQPARRGRYAGGARGDLRRRPRGRRGPPPLRGRPGPT